jgi:uncharacterized lipoprotein YehR (DUF1307 family)
MDALLKTGSKLVFRLGVDVLTVFVLMRFVYYSAYKKTELFFTYFIFNLVIFLICFLLNKVDLSMGAAFGLFAVFSMLRYRTDDISMKDMTYLFLVIAIGLINAVTKIKDAGDAYEYGFLIFINGIIVLVAYLLDSKVIFKKESVKIINYDNIELIKQENQQALIEDISKRTGIKVIRVSISKIDFLKDAAQIKIYYYED